MILAKLVRVRTLVILVLLVCLALVGIKLLDMSKPTITITVVGEHNPITDFVYVNNKLALPGAEGGSVYKTKGKVGQNTISIDGPYIYHTDVLVDADFFGAVQTEIKSDGRENETIIRQTVGEPNATIFGLRIYPDSNTMVFGLSGDLSEPIEGEEGYGVILHYDPQSRKWTDATQKATESYEDYEGNDRARAYLYDLTED